jgi:hypothetical protein
VTFQPNMLTLWTLALVILFASVKVLLRVVRILTGGERGVVFDIRLLPEFLGDDILFEVGGLLILALPTFIAPTGLPDSFAAALLALQGIYVGAAFSLLGKYLAKIRDLYPMPAIAGTTDWAAPGPAPTTDIETPSTETGRPPDSTRAPPG